MNSKLAEEIAIKALEFLATSETYFGNFLNYSGTSIEDLNQTAQTVAFQMSILNFICLDESLLLSFCEASNVSPNDPYRAFQYLEHYN